MPAARRAVLLRISPWGGTEMHGGQLRSQQIAALVARARPDALVHVAPALRGLPRAAQAALAVRAGLGMLGGQSPMQALFTAFVDRTIAGLGLEAGDLVIYDADQRYGAATARVAARRGLRLVALTHNVEALIPYRWPIAIDVARVSGNLAREVGWLARADQVWAIGCFDRELFQLFGIDARLLPYAPPAARAAELAAIRARRGAPAHLLILGTAHNAPTRAGMVEQMALAPQLPGSLPVIVAGYGTEALAAEAPPRVTVLGAQSWPALTDLLAGAAALWVHQAPMSGALTRIPEALMAGVPVVANGWGARGHAAMDGLICYADVAGLAAAIRDLPRHVAVPDFSGAEAEFVAALQAF
jgi:glycosyltransferase involved in cell wall biosynthesis